MKFKRSELVQLSGILDALSQERSPLSFVIVRNQESLKEINKTFFNKRDELLDTYAKKDENGDVLFIEGASKEQKLDEIQWKDEKAFFDKFNELSNEEVEFVALGVSPSKLVWHSKREKEVQLSEILEEKYTAGSISLLMHFGIVEK